MVVGGAVNGFLMVSQQFSLVPAINNVLPDMPSYYVGWIGFFLAVVILLGGSYLEGETAVPGNVRGRVATDGGVESEDDDVVEEADSALKQVQY